MVAWVMCPQASWVYVVQRTATGMLSRATCTDLLMASLTKTAARQDNKYLLYRSYCLVSNKPM